MDWIPIIELLVLVGGIIYAAGQVVGGIKASTKQLHDSLATVNAELAGLRENVAQLGELAASLQAAISAMADRVADIERRTVAEVAAKLEPPARKTHRPVRSRKRKDT